MSADPVLQPKPSPPREFIADEPDAGLLTCVPDERTEPRRRLRWLLTGERDEPTPSRLDPTEAPDAQRLGVCCSGGGIRSAAFNLGALQSLAGRGVLTRAKYLAAVSGGSYIAAGLSMVAKTAPGGAHDDSDSGQVDTDRPPFHPGSPEEQYLRNRSSYLAPDGLGKLFLGVRVLMGLVFNLVFLGLLLFAAGIALALVVYRPWFPGLTGERSCPAPEVGAPLPCFTAGLPDGAVALLIVVGALAVVLGVAVLLVRARNDMLRRAIETWTVRLVILEAALVVVLVVVPLLVEVLREYAAREATATAADTTGHPVLPAIGAGGVASLLVAVLLQLRAKATEPAAVLASVTGVQAALRRLAPKLRLAFAYLAATLAGPLLLLGIVVLGAALTLAHSSPVATSGGIYGALAGSVGLFGLIYAAADLNTWSLHPFYRRRLCTAFALKRIEVDGRPVARERDYDRLVPLSRSGVQPGPGRTSWPTLIVCAAANVSDPGATPPGRAVTSFTFSPTAIGGPLVGAARTTAYERALGRDRQRDITLPAAVAMSGAALSPSMGKLTRRPLTFLMALANVRLGVWVPNPRYVQRWSQRDLRHRVKASEPMAADGKRRGPRDIVKRPRPSYLVRELLGRNRLGARFLYVSDGGHYENLGLVELLRRGCGQIVCFDASGGTSFGSLGDAVALARSELGVQIDIDPRPLLEAGERHLAATDCVTGTFRYRGEGWTGRLIYARTVMTPDAPWDVHAYHDADETFPHHSTADQLYTDQKFEAYRALGELAGRHAADVLESSDAAKGGDGGDGTARVGAAVTDVTSQAEPGRAVPERPLAALRTLDAPSVGHTPVQPALAWVQASVRDVRRGVRGALAHVLGLS